MNGYLRMVIVFFLLLFAGALLYLSRIGYAINPLVNNDYIYSNENCPDYQKDENGVCRENSYRNSFRGRTFSGGGPNEGK